ncbi:MAG: xanthine dehydrogenase family protein subunit M [Pseudomonadota bacterium]
MTPFDYVRPTTIPEAIAAASEPGTAVLAGGTNLLDLMKAGAASPKRVVDIGQIAGLDSVEVLADGALRIGALVRNADLANHFEILARAPAVAEALLSGASPQLRNAATVGGNLLQQTRCPYFYDVASACNRRADGAGCDALGGQTHGHAIIGWTETCIATHPSDFAVPLVALDAEVEIEGPAGRRLLPLEQLYQLPSEAGAPSPALAPGEIVTALLLPPSATPLAPHSRYLKLRERTSYAFALVSAAAALRIADGRIIEARLALGGVAARPWRARNAEAALSGAEPGAELFVEAGRLAVSEARPSGDNASKITLAARVASRALARAAHGTPETISALPASVFSPVEGELSDA